MSNKAAIIGIAAALLFSAIVSAAHGTAVLGYLLRFIAALGFVLSIVMAFTAKHPDEARHKTTDAVLCFLALCIANYAT